MPSLHRESIDSLIIRSCVCTLVLVSCVFHSCTCSILRGDRSIVTARVGRVSTLSLFRAPRIFRPLCGHTSSSANADYESYNVIASKHYGCVLPQVAQVAAGRVARGRV